MYQNKIINSSVNLILAIAISALIGGTPAVAEGGFGANVKSDDIAVFDLDATIMEINAQEGYVVIAEKRFNITEYLVDGKKYQSELTNQNGDPVDLGAFKSGQRVLVRGFELTDGIHIADSVQMSSSAYVEKESRKIKRLRPIGTGD
jgi:hypothetical protein